VCTILPTLYNPSWHLTAGRRTEKLKDDFMKHEVKAKLADASGASAPSR
jgi:hypothetical protein